MQVIGAHLLRRAGPSISVSRTTATGSPTPDVTSEETQQHCKKESCKPRSLSKSCGHTRDIVASTSSPEPASLTGALCSAIDDFLDEVASEGFVLKQGESAIASRMKEVELRETIMSPVSDASECLSDCDALNLTYSLPRSFAANADAAPRVRRETKPVLDGVGDEVPEVPAKSQERARPSVAWSRLGSRGYYFAADGRIVWK